MGGNETTGRIAWDSCVFLAWFKDEEDKPLGSIELVLRDVEQKKLVLIVSTIVAAEVLDETGVSSAGSDFRNFMRRSNAVPANVDMRVAELAATYRERAKAALARGIIKKSFKAPDAIIAATATIYRVRALHTFDPDLLALSGKDIVDGLKICRPDHDDLSGPLLF